MDCLLVLGDNLSTMLDIVNKRCAYYTAIQQLEIWAVTEVLSQMAKLPPVARQKRMTQGDYIVI